MKIRILKPARIISFHYLSGTVPTVHLQPKQDLTLAYVPPCQCIWDTVKKWRFRPTLPDLNSGIRRLQPCPPSPRNTSMAFSSISEFARIFREMNTFGDIPRTMRQTQSLGSDRPSFILTNLSALDQVLRLKLLQKIPSMALAETS
jgi:hypothetical protein